MSKMNRMKAIGYGVAFVGALFVGACGNQTSTTGGSASGSAAQTAAAAPVTEAQVKEAFEQRCGSCHGVEGKGNGPAAASLKPPPRDYSDKEWQKSVTDEQLKKVIIYGGAAVGKSAAMPAAPDLESQPAMVEGLIKKIRSYGK